MQFPVLSAGACPMCAALHLWHNSCCRRTNEGWQTHLLHLWLERYAIIYPDKKPQIRINRWSQNETKLKQIVYVLCTHSPGTFPSAGVQSLQSQSVMMFIVHICLHTTFGLGLVCVYVCVVVLCVFPYSLRTVAATPPPLISDLLIFISSSRLLFCLLIVMFLQELQWIKHDQRLFSERVDLHILAALYNPFYMSSAVNRVNLPFIPEVGHYSGVLLSSPCGKLQRSGQLHARVTRAPHFLNERRVLECN